MSDLTHRRASGPLHLWHVSGEKEYDAVIVGARCAGSTLAITLADRGWDVLVVDRAHFPSETVSTHLIYPNTLARFEQLGVLDTLRASHEVPLLAHRVIALGHQVEGLFTSIEGFDRAASPRRSALDKAVIDTAIEAGAEFRFGERAVELIGSGTEDDPVAGVTLQSGESIGAKWVFGADGRGSIVAGRLGIEKQRPLSGEVSFLFAYWKSIPDDGYATLDIRERHIISRWAVEDGLHLLVATGDAELTRGTNEERERKYLDVLKLFPETIAPEVLERGEMVTDLVVAPESMMRGFFRTPTGPGWALVGDACHFKHPGTAQGICDAVERRSTSPNRSRGRSRASRATRSGAMPAPGSTTSGPSPGAASPGWRSQIPSSGDGRASPMPGRTCGTPSAAWWGPPS